MASGCSRCAGTSQSLQLPQRSSCWPSGCYQNNRIRRAACTTSVIDSITEAPRVDMALKESSPSSMFTIPFTILHRWEELRSRTNCYSLRQKLYLKGLRLLQQHSHSQVKNQIEHQERILCTSR